MSSSSLMAVLSVPSATFSPPADPLASTGATPFFSRRLELALWQTVAPAAGQQVYVGVGEPRWAWAQESSGPRKPRSPRWVAGVRPHRLSP